MTGNNTNSRQRVPECRRVESCVAAASSLRRACHPLRTLRSPLTQNGIRGWGRYRGSGAAGRCFLCGHASWGAA
jgi:hypothetical protein